MKFIELGMQNFLAVGRALVRMDDVGLVLIQGENMDEPSAKSNGAGKSTIPDALMWCLFGETARGVSGDLVVNDKAKKDCFVSVAVQDGESIYQIIRYRKHKEGKNSLLVRAYNPAATWPMGASVVMEKGTERETQAVIDAILGCSKEVFAAAVYAGQEAMPDLPKMTDKQLKLLIEEAAGVERLERAYEGSRAKLAEAESNALRASTQIERDRAMLAKQKADLEPLQEKLADFEVGRSDRHDEHDRQAKAIAIEIKALAARVASANQPALTLRRDEIAGSLAAHSELLAKRDAMSAALHTAQTKAEIAGRDFANEKERANKINEHIREAGGRIGVPCRTCGKPHTEADVEVVRGNLTKELREAVERATTLKATFASLVDTAGVAKKELSDFQATIPDVSALSAELAHIERSLSAIEADRATIRLKKSHYDARVLAATRAMTEPNPHVFAIEHMAKSIIALEGEIAKKEEEVSRLQCNAELWKQVVKVFSPAGVRAHILDTVTPFLNERTSEYLSTLSDGSLSAVWSTLTTTAKGDLKEKFNIEVENSSGAKCFAGLSGGEKRKVRLATMLALQDLVATRATKPIDLWIGDEIDHALDPAGLERLMGVLETKARERGSVLVISHNELTDWADNVTTVTKSGGFSAITGALVVS